MRALVIGYGSIGARHAANARLLGEVSVLELCETRRGAAIAQGFLTFAELETALDWQADTVIIATPHDSHMRLARAAVGHCRAILVEKPFGMDAAEMDTMLAEADASGTEVFGVCNMRYHPAVRALSENLHAVGEPIFARAHYGNFLPEMRSGVDYRRHYAADATSGGALMDGVHDIDLVVWLVGPAEVRHASLMCSGTLGIEAVDCAALHLEHVSGARSELHVDYLRRIKLRGLEVTGRDGTIVWESVGKNPEHATVRLRTKNDQAVRLVFDNDDVDANAPYQAMLADLAAALDGRDHRL